ncbi:UDP-N-acetylmuramate--L-alanine ligase [Spirochaetia bacterium]|nr:UDP-N-acetylmuramate--L-alanine ligase [Spirochaetia bacterium]
MIQQPVTFNKDDKVYMIGIKGTGMCAFAEILHNRGIQVCGSDVEDIFYTDAILKELNIPYYEGFNESNVPDDANIIIYSAAYNSETNVELKHAFDRKGRVVLKYTDALGEYSAMFDSSSIAGVHGKTTTTAMSGIVARAMGIEAQVLAGSAIGNFSSDINKPRCTLCLGDKYFIAETCEYREHFMSFNPKQIVLTSVESDHQDYYPTYDSIRDAFVRYVHKLPKTGGTLIYCADDIGAVEVAKILKLDRPDVNYVPYGFNAESGLKITNYKCENETNSFCLQIGEMKPIDISLQVSGKHNVLDATAAIALCCSLIIKEGMLPGDVQLQNAATALSNFKGSKRRQEILGERNGILFIDDYAHHPSAIKTTLNGLKSFYKERRIVVSFMSHTYTRTKSLLNDFASAFEDADVLILHKIYSSARETPPADGFCGMTLFEKTKENFSNEASMLLANVNEKIFYYEEPLDAFSLLKNFLKPGDLFLTMGAGDNWKLGKKLFSD